MSYDQLKNKLVLFQEIQNIVKDPTDTFGPSPRLRFIVHYLYGFISGYCKFVDADYDDEIIDAIDLNYRYYMDGDEGLTFCFYMDQFCRKRIKQLKEELKQE